MKTTRFNKKRLSTCISLMLGAAVATPSIAQESEDEQQEVDGVEVIQVSGIRGSLSRAQNIKRYSSGIVDAISAEDIGKFPDTNLAESLQRITGVTISRNNNEGSQITVRGFGPDFNLLTLNGRQMPGTGNSRSFALENLASTGVNTLEVYKSSKVDVPSGGLGATVNITTVRPLNDPGRKFSLVGKGIYDESNEQGDDVTPEFAALYSDTFNDDTFGVALSFSHQERDFQRQEAEVPGWQANQVPSLDGGRFSDARPLATSLEQDLLDGVEDGRVGANYVPRQIAYRVNDVERVRTNAHLTLQWAPRDDMKFTADYLYNESETANEGYGFGVWFNFGGNATSYELDENGTAIRYTESGGDFAHNRVSETLLVEQDSIGFNWEWQVNDYFKVELDYHDSSVEQDNGRDPGTRANTNLILGPNNIVEKTYSFVNGSAPQFDIEWPNRQAEALPEDFEPLFAIFNRGLGESEVKQFQLDTEWTNPYDSFITTVQFGLARTEQTTGGRFTQLNAQGAQQFQGLPFVFPDNMFTRSDQSDILDEFFASPNTNYFYDFSLSEGLARMAGFFPGFRADPFNAEGEIVEINNIGDVLEETDSAYISAAMYFEIADMPLDVNLGVRHERTDVISTNVQASPTGLRWFGGAEWRTLFDQSLRETVVGTGEHSVTLPSIDFKLQVAEDMYTRLSWGKSITRAPLGNLAANRSLTPRPVPGSRTGSFGNPSLDPFESKNFDIAFDWYFGDASYVSVGYFRKDVKNFINSFNTQENIFTFDGLRDPFAGPRAQEAIAQLQAEGEQTSVQNIFDRMIANGGGVEVDNQPAIEQRDDDPIVEWLISQPTNNPEEQSVDGVEFAVQHMFGDTGLGASVNATFVNSDSEFDVNSLDVQSPLVGVSDSANVQVFYEDDKWSGRITYAWRDDFLAGVGQGGGSADAPPQFVRAAGIVDFNVSYNVTEHFIVFAEGFNVFNETEERYGRFEEQFLEAAQFGPRYTLGVRYNFE